MNDEDLPRLTDRSIAEIVKRTARACGPHYRTPEHRVWSRLVIDSAGGPRRPRLRRPERRRLCRTSASFTLRVEMRRGPAEAGREAKVRAGAGA